MADVIKQITPSTTTQLERRCSHTVGTNNLDLPILPEMTIEQLAAKFSVTMTLWDEPQDADGNTTGIRTRVGDKQVPMAEALARNFTAAGVTLPGYVVMALYNEIIDTYKGD